MSAMRLESNGLKSCGEKSRHIDIRFFFIKDVLKRENIELRHCPTDRMIADYFTKPLQGSLFRKMKAVIMGVTSFPVEKKPARINGIILWQWSFRSDLRQQSQKANSRQR